MTIPGFTAETGIYASEGIYGGIAHDGRAAAGAVVLPQFRSHVRTQCGKCVNGKKTCFVFGYECTVIEGGPGSDELGIPGPGSHVHCEPEIFNEFERKC